MNSLTEYEPTIEIEVLTYAILIESLDDLIFTENDFF